MDAPHPFRVTFCQVVVDRHDVDPVPGQRIQVGREGGNKRLSFAGAHLCDVAEMQGCTPHDLNVVVTLAQRAPGCFTNGCERLGHQIVEALPVGVARLELIGEAAQLVV